MTTIDILILIVMGIGLVLGFMKGFFKQLASIVGIIAGLLVARALFGMVGERLAPEIGTSVTVAQIISFVVIWVAVPFVLYLIATLLTKILSAIHLGFVNRLLGGLLGVAISVLWIGVFIQVLQYVDPNSELVSANKKEVSLLYTPIEELSELFFPAIKQVTEQIIK